MIALLCVSNALALGVPTDFVRVQEAPRARFVAEGHPFWSLGIDCTDTGVEPNKIDPKNPGYSALSLFASEKAWVLDTQTKFGNWGVNTLGGWSDDDLFTKYGGAARPWYTIVLHLGAYDKAPWHDLFSSGMYKAIDGAAKAQIPPVKDDPKLIGYFTDNELGWWDDTLFSTYLQMPKDAPGRQKLISLLRQRYGTFDAFKRDWIPTGDSFETLTDAKLRPLGQGRLTVKAWAGVLATQYYGMVQAAVRRYDHNHLILGDRYCQYYSLPVLAASRQFIDVASTNLGADWNDGSNCRFFLDSLHEVTGKPVVISEFYMTARENRSGDKNSSDGFPVVDTQQERADATSRYLADVSARPYVLGAHWFQYYDEPGNGRGDGENYNMGLVDIHGQPYELMAKAFAEFHPRLPVRPAGSAGAPRAPKDPFSSLKAWDRTVAFVSPTNRGGVADLYASWSPDGLYLGLYQMDYCDKSLYPGSKVPLGDCSDFRASVNGGSPVDIRFADVDPPVVTGPTGVVAKQSGGLRRTLVVFIPSKTPLRRGERISISADSATHGRAELSRWSTTLVLLK